MEKENKIVKLNKPEMMYMSTGRFRMYYPENSVELVKDDWRELFRILIAKNVKSIELGLDSIKEPYKKIAEYFESGVFSSGDDVREYFESLYDVDEEMMNGKVSHNVLLFRTCVDEKDLEQIYQRELCSLKVTDVKNKKTWGFAGVYENMRINKKHFNFKIEGDYLLTHGSSLIGLIAVKSIDKEEFEKYRAWYEEVHKHPKNPFVAHKMQIMNMLKD